MADRAYLTRPDVLDDLVRADLRDAENGDAEAVRELHRFLAEYLRVGKLTPFMRDILASMHESIAAGRGADVAMLTKPLRGRPPMTSRDQRICEAIAARVQIMKHASAHRGRIEVALGHPLPPPPTMTQLYRDAAKQFGVTQAQAKRIYLARAR